VTSCRVSTNAKTIAVRKHKDNTNKKQKTISYGCLYLTRISKNICRFTNCISSRNTSSGRTVAGGATEHGKVSYIFRVAINQIIIIIIIIIISSPMKWCLLTRRIATFDG
jgi:hypothetical protein